MSYPIPSNARRIAYLESTGTQWIDTGIVPNGATGIDCDFAILNATQNFSPVFWSRGSSSTDRAFCFEGEVVSGDTKGQARWDYGSYGAKQVRNVIEQGVKTTASVRNGTLTVAGSVLTRAEQTFTGAGSIILFNFCDYVNGKRQMLSVACQPVRIYSFTIYNGSTIVRDFVPISIDNEGCLFDKVSGQVFHNSGTGDFVLGSYLDRVPLPSYARRIEYLESTGTQWIDTGLGYFPDFEIGCKMRESVGNVTVGVNNAWSFSRNSPTDPTWKLLANDRPLNTSVPVTSYVDASYKNGSFVANSTVIASEPNQFVSGDMLVFTRGSNLPASYPAILYYLKCYDWNGNLVRSFVPCRILGVGYLWDEVEGKFYGNSGTGGFVLGPDVQEGVVPNRLNPFGISRRQEEIRRVEYLESTGVNTGPWIDTGVVPSGTTRWEMDVEYGLSSVVYMGVDATQKFMIASRLGGNMDIQFALGSVYVAIKPTSFGGRHSVYLDAATKKCGVDTASADIAGSYSLTGSSIYLFGANNGSGVVTLKRESKIYACRIYQNGILVRDFVPVRVGSIGYLLDRVSGRLFGNSGSGNFVLGPDIVPVEWVSAPLGAYVDSGVMLTPTMSIVLEAISGGNTPRQQRLFGYSDSTLGNTVLYVNGSGYMAATIAGTGGYNNFEPFADRRVNASMSMGDGAASIRITYPNGTVRDWSSTIGVLGGAYSATLPIFAFSRETGVDVGVECLFRLVSLSVFDGSTLVRDFVPVRVGTEGALYDRVTDTVFRSATSTPLLTPS